MKIIGLPIHLRSDVNVTSFVSSLGKILEVDGQHWKCIDLAFAHACILIIECVDVQEPFPKYYNSNDCSLGTDIKEDLEEDVENNASSDEDGDGISYTWCENFDDLEEGEIVGNFGDQDLITSGNDDVGRQSSTTPILVIPKNINAVLNAKHEKSSDMHDSNRSADFDHVGPTIPITSPSPPDGSFPISLAQINGNPCVDPLLDVPISIPGVCEPKSKKIDRSTFNIPSFSLPPRRLSAEFGNSPNSILVFPTLAASYDINISI